MVTRDWRKEVACSHPTSSCNAAEPTTVGSDHNVLLHGLAALRRSEAVLRDFIETSTIGLHWVDGWDSQVIASFGTYLMAGKSEVIGGGLRFCTGSI
jgi:hypothetical protein